MKYFLVLPLFCRSENWGIEKLSNLFKVTYLVKLKSEFILLSTSLYCFTRLFLNSLMDSVREGEGGKIWENGTETCKISCMKRKKKKEDEMLQSCEEQTGYFPVQSNLTDQRPGGNRGGLVWTRRKIREPMTK